MVVWQCVYCRQTTDKGTPKEIAVKLGWEKVSIAVKRNTSMKYEDSICVCGEPACKKKLRADLDYMARTIKETLR